MVKWFRITTAAVLAGAVGLLNPSAALAASPEFARTAKEWARLQDNTIEYDELEALIHEYNATVQNNAYSYRKFREDYGDTNEEVYKEYVDLAQDFYDDMSGENDANSLASDLSLQIQAENLLRQADNTLEDSKIYLMTYEQAEKSLVVTAQSDMISYYKKLLERQEKETERSNANRSCELAQLRLSAGTATQLDVLTAQEAAQTAQNALDQLDTEIQTLKERFFVLLGWKHDDNPTIGELPEVDLTRIEAMNPEADLETALENNYTLKINKRKLENARNETTRENLESTIAGNQKQIGSSLSSAYKTVLSARLSYEQAVTEAGLEAENLRVAQGRRQAGMMTDLEYQEQEAAKTSADLKARKAGLELLEAMETYDWSVKGLASAE